MRYNLIFSIIGIVFSSMMIVAYFMKRRKNNVQSKFYVCLIIMAMLYALLDIASIFMLRHVNVGNEFLRIIWNIRNSAFYVYVYVFGWYLSVLVKNEEYNNLSTFFKKTGNLLSLVL